MLPKISIITPSFNQGAFIEETILSVINQEYENIEYIIIDGNSSDNTMSIVEKYKDRISFSISEPDSGQPNAINKGLQRATGDIIAFINSDDYYEPATFQKIAGCFLEGHEWVIGGVRNFDSHAGTSEIVLQRVDDDLKNWIVRNNYNHQPGNFWSRKVFDKVGFFDENLHYAFDWEYWIRFVQAGFKPKVLNDQVVANFRLHDTSKTIKQWVKFNADFLAIMYKYKVAVDEQAKQEIEQEIIKIQVNDRIKLGRIESINGNFSKSFNLFWSALKLKPSQIFNISFLRAFSMSFFYMPIRKKILK